VGPIYSIADAASDPHFREREVFLTWKIRILA
jgi:crotonobetainyl-CoA:carnitine CoA-transferase CaiB-like acyl-CoA transferase